MKILSNEPCDISDYCGNIIVSYIKEDEKEAKEIIKWLESRGYDYEDNEITPINLFNGSYCDKYNALLKNCGLYIFPVTKNFKEKFRPLINVILYQAGVLDANGGEERIYPFVFESYDKEKKRLEIINAGKPKKDQENIINLNDIPFRNNQTPKSIETLDAKFGEVQHKLVSVYDYVKNDLSANNSKSESARIDQIETDKNSASNSGGSIVSLFRDFISYRKLTVHFDITEEAINNCIKTAKNSKIKTEEGIIEWLNTGIQCGTRIFAFGNDSTITNNTRPYEEESRLDSNIALTVPNSRSYFIKNSNEEFNKTKIKGTLVTEFIIPVHILLGVYYKCFIRCYNVKNKDQIESNWAYALKTLLMSNFDKSDVTLYQNDMYFCFETQNSSEDKYKISIPSEYGTISNYMHPQ